MTRYEAAMHLFNLAVYRSARAGALAVVRANRASLQAHYTYAACMGCTSLGAATDAAEARMEKARWKLASVRRSAPF